MSYIELRDIEKSYYNGDKKIEILKHLNLSIVKGEFLTLFGPNGCGKSTLMNILTGIVSYDKGEISINSNKEKPNVSYVFQNYRESLMPWLNVEENICFPLKIKGYDNKNKKKMLEELINKFNIKIDLKAKTYDLSGGQAQLVSIIRGLITDPDILILDEPFSALDYQTNLTLYSKVLEIWKQAQITILLISHEIDEAIYLGDRVAFLSQKPTRIKEILKTNLPRPRKMEMFGSPEFANVKEKALKIFLEEVS